MLCLPASGWFILWEAQIGCNPAQNWQRDCVVIQHEAAYSVLGTFYVAITLEQAELIT